MEDRVEINRPKTDPKPKWYLKLTKGAETLSIFIMSGIKENDRANTDPIKLLKIPKDITLRGTLDRTLERDKWYRYAEEPNRFSDTGYIIKVYHKNQHFGNVSYIPDDLLKRFETTTLDEYLKDTEF